MVIVDSAGDTSAVEPLLRSGFREENEVTFLTDSTFTETGRWTFGDGQNDAIHFDTLVEGHMAPSPDPVLVNGTVTWRITEGTGSFSGVSGMIVENFLLEPEAGTYRGIAMTTIFLP